MELKGNTAEEKIWNFLIEKGLSPAGAAGLMGNLYAESGLNPRNLQNSFERKLGHTDGSYTAAVDDGSYGGFVRDGAGYGLAQWTYWSRKEKLINFVRSRKCSVGDLGAQLEFLFGELSGGYRGVLETLRTAVGVREASDSVLLGFERPADQSGAVRARRAGYGEAYYKRYAGKGDGMGFKLVERFLTRNPCYQAGKKMRVQGLMLHSVGCPQPKASVFIERWDSPDYARACVHGFIDADDGTVYQTLPWEYRGWHGGSGSNNTHIGVEMCEPACIRYTGGARFTCSDAASAKEAVRRTYEAAVGLFAMLCKRFCLDPLADGVVISHREGHERGIASGHEDPEHLWNQLGTGYTMDGFRRAVKEAMDGGAAPEEAVRKEPAVTEPARNEPVKAASEAFRVRIRTPYLNIRKGPGTNHLKAGEYTGPGVFTVVDVQEGVGSDAGWGLLKSYEKGRDGWIALDFAERL